MRAGGVLVAEVVFWWAATLGVWLLTLSSVDDADLIVATPLALACALVAAAARGALAARWRYPPRAAVWALRLPIAIVADTARVLALPWRRLLGRLPQEGVLVRVPVAPGADVEPVSWRTAAAVLVSATPGTCVLHADHDTGELLVHDLIPGSRWSMSEAVRR